MRLSLAIGFASLALLAVGCGGDIGTSQTGDKPSDPGPSQQGDDDDDGATPEPAQLAITRFEVATAAGTDDYEPNETNATAFYLGGFGFEYTIDDATIAPTNLTYTVEVTNTGGPVTDPFNVEFFRNSASAPVSQLGDVRQEVPALDAGASVELSFDVPNADPGMLQSWAAADVSNVIPETDENDNLSAGVPAAVALDVDVYSVFQTAGFPLTVSLSQLPANYDLEILSQNGTVLARSENGGTSSESLSGTVGSDGTYRIRVYGNGSARSATPYRLVITVP